MNKNKRSKEHIEAMKRGKKASCDLKAVFVICPVCGKESRRPPSQSKVLCCSLKCKYAQWEKDIRPNIVYKKWTEEEKISVRKRKNILCVHCKKEFEVAIGSTRKFCGRSCFHKHGRADIAGKNNSNYRHGLSKTKEYANHIQKLREYRKKGAGGTHTLAEWKELLVKHNHSCAICGLSENQVKMTRDHIIPVSLGGDSSIANIQPLCALCNSRKSNKV